MTDANEPLADGSSRRRDTTGPVGLAVRAVERGDAFFQIDLPVPSSAANAYPDLLGQIEQVGWTLEHVGFVFVQSSSRDSNPVLSSGRRSVIDGEIRGVYLFRVAR